MIRRLLNKTKKITNSIKMHYIKYCTLPIDEKLVLIEGGQGSNINGNMFAMLKELKTNPQWAQYKIVFVVNADTKQKAQMRMEFYGFKGVVLTIRDTREYCKYLATAKYIMTDNSFPPYFNKRNEQVFFNTWHGTPLKTLGKSNKASLASMANIQKNYLMSDYALFPNEFTKNVFMKDYDLENIYSGYCLIANYPRNYIFYDKNAGVKLKKQLGFDGKKVFAYMPTWRDASTNRQKQEQLDKTVEILDEFDAKLDDNSVLLVNLHFLLASEINCDKYKHIQYFSNDWDTYEILNACDGLITDYSSVFFDYAVTEKKIIMFAYDKEEYLSSRGLYMPFESLPFPIVETVDGVIDQMSKETPVPQEFIATYCPKGWADSCYRLFDMMVSGKTDSYTLEKNETAGKDICLINGGGLSEMGMMSINEYISANPNKKYVIAYRKNCLDKNRDKVAGLGSNVSVLGTVTAFQFTVKEVVAVILSRMFGIVKDSKTVNNFFTREAGRIFHSLQPESVVDFSNSNTFITGIISKLSGKKSFNIHNTTAYVSPQKYNQIVYSRKYEQANGFEKIGSDKTDKSSAYPDFKKSPVAKNIVPLYLKFGSKMVCVSIFSIKTGDKIRLNDVTLTIGNKPHNIKFVARKNKLAKKHCGIYYFSLNAKDTVDMAANNAVAFNYTNNNEQEIRFPISYFAPLGRLFLGLRGPMTVDKDTQTVAIFRQVQRNKLIIYVRSVNVTDSFKERIKQIIAFVCAKLWHTKKAKKLVLLYEKNSSKYEESASVLFENLIDQGYKNAYFIVTKDYEFFDRIPKKYLSNIVYKYSFKHYLYFFKSKTFIGTEAIAHSIDLKTFNVLALKKIASKNINYVFLQHGVMYMVSLNSESRKMFKRKNLNGKYRVVVSSQAEADHFTELGKHLEEDLYITGLPKFDRNTHNENADKIVIMPTWRPWEINTARADFTQTDYFKMLMRIFDSVPDELKEKVIILPHPLIVNELGKMADNITDKIVVGVRYDDILKDTDILITDYSSIAFDAFYRGAKVIFYWEEKDFCMEQYGPSTTLMLNEENVYGDYFYSQNGLKDTIRNTYKQPQSEEYKNRYTKLVTYHDGKNTNRLIEFLKNDNII